MSALVLLLSLASHAGAVQDYQPGLPEDPENPAIMAVNNSVSLAYLNSNLDYVEPSDEQAFNTGTSYLDYERASLNGLRLAVNWMSPAYSDLYVHADWDWASGRANYTGFDQKNNPVTGDSGATIQDFGLKIGKGIVTGRHWMLTPYGTFGGRHWTRVIGEGTSGDFNETYQHLYAGFGGLIQYAPSEGWVVTGDATLARTFYAWINDAPDGLSHAPLGGSPLIKLGLEADRRITDRLHAFIGFDYMYFRYGQSDVYLVPNSNPQLVVMEPASETNMYNVTVGARFAY